MFKIKDAYNRDLQTPKTMELHGSTRKLFNKTKKSGENVPSIEVVKVFLVQGNLADNQYQQKSEVFFEPTNLVFLKTYSNEFDEIILTFTNQNGRPLEIEDKVNLTLPLNK